MKRLKFYAFFSHKMLNSNHLCLEYVTIFQSFVFKNYYFVVFVKVTIFGENISIYIDRISLNLVTFYFDDSLICTTPKWCMRNIS